MSPDSLRLIVADDEALARKLARQYVARVPDVEIVAECADTGELELALSRQQADAALLDIRMPGRDVFDVLSDVARSGPLPALIFATAYDRYAVRAFEINAVDYLVKPYTESRFAEALLRVRERHQLDVHGGDVPRLLRDLGRRPDRVLVPEGDRIVPLPVARITWIRAEGDYARVHSGGKSYLVYRTLNDLENRFDPTEFLRVHRSAIVRVDQIAEIQPADSGRYGLTLTDGTRLIVSRSRGRALKKLML
jgi:two-component system, LytTR family, response regulator